MAIAENSTSSPSLRAGATNRDLKRPKRTRFHISYWLAALLGLLLGQWLFATPSDVASIPYSQFEILLDQGKVSEVTVSDRMIQGKLRTPLDGKSQFVTMRVDQPIAAQLKAHSVKFSGYASSILGQIFSWIAPTLFFFVIWYVLTRRMGGQAGSLLAIGKSRVKVYLEADTGVTFEDVAGVDEAKEELREVIAFLKDPASYGRLGARMPKGVLLVGPPGTGKTLLAKAVAGEAHVPFFSISGSEFVEMFVGVGAARVRDLFEQADKYAPCIIFIDELDALGRARGLGAWGGLDEKEQTLDQLLAEMDGFDSRSGVVILAATNRPEILDPALLRAGRFDRHILVDRPDRAGRVQILHVHLGKITLAPDADADTIAALTPGFTGADLANLVNEAALHATRRGATATALADFTAAVERIVAGLEKHSRLLNERERRIVAYHEMGHALVALALPGADKVHKVSIIPRGIGALGYTMQRPAEDRFVLQRSELLDRMTVLLGGRAAEMLIMTEVSTGAADDLRKATDLARDMVVRYGMSAILGPVALDDQPQPLLPIPDAMSLGQRRLFSEATAASVDGEVRALLEAALKRAGDILARRRVALDEGARLLLERETIEETDLVRIGSMAVVSGKPAA